MASTGRIDGSTGGIYIGAYITWEITDQDIVNNTSTVVAKLCYYRKTDYDTYGTGTFTITIGDSSKTENKHLFISGNGNSACAISHEAIVKHNADGTKSVKISASGSIPGTTLTSSSVLGYADLDFIPKVTTFDSLTCSLDWFNGKYTYKYTPKHSSLYNRCDINLNGSTIKTINLGAKSASQQTETLFFTQSELESIYTKLPNTMKGTLRFIISTYSDSGYSKRVGAEYKDITLTIADTYVKPTVSLTLTPLSDLPSPYDSMYIQGFSRVKANIGTTTKYGATVVATSITVNGKTYESPYETDFLSQTGKVSVKATVKDSRGLYGTYYQEIDVIPYEKPYVRAKSNESSIIVARCNSSAEFTDDGTYLKIKAKVVYHDVNQNNYGFIKFRYRKEGGAYSAWQTILDCEKDKSDEVITPPLLNGDMTATDNYQVQLIASDDLGDSAPITFAVPSVAVYMHRPPGGKSMAIGGYSTGDDAFDVYFKTKARGGLSMFFKGDEIPLDSTLPIPKDQIKGSWNPDELECGIYVVSGNCDALKSGENVIMSNGVLIQMVGSVSGNVKIQLALPVDTNRNPMYRLCWYNNWADWRSLKI